MQMDSVLLQAHPMKEHKKENKIIFKNPRVCTACYCPSCLMALMDTFRIQKASITATETTDFLPGLSDGICTAHAGRAGENSSMQNFIVKKSCNYLLVRAHV